MEHVCIAGPGKETQQPLSGQVQIIYPLYVIGYLMTCNYHISVIDNLALLPLTLSTCKNKNINKSLPSIFITSFWSVYFFNNINNHFYGNRQRSVVVDALVMLHVMVYTPRNLLMVIILLAFLNPVQRSGGWIRTTAKCLHCHFGYTWTNLFINVFCSIMPKSFTNELIRHDLTGRGHVFREVTPLRSRDWPLKAASPQPLPKLHATQYFFLFFSTYVCYALC